MFQEILLPRSDLFEFIVYYGLREFKWKLYCKEEGEWQDRDLQFVDGVALSKPDEKVLKNMTSNVFILSPLSQVSCC